MNNSEYEIISYEHIKHIHILLVSMIYRNPHLHKELEVCLILDGSATIRTKENTFHVSTGDIVLFNSNSMHEIRSTGNRQVLILSLQISNHFCMEYINNLRNTEFLLPSDNIMSLFDENARIALRNRLFCSAISYYENDIARRFYCIGQICEIIATFFNGIPFQIIDEDYYVSKKNKALRLSRITDYVEHHYKEKILLRDIAERENVSLPYLSHFFRENMGMTFQDYLNDIRLESALLLIDNKNLNILDVFMESGFSDYRYLNKMFMQRFGCLPSMYRKQAQSIAPHVSDNNTFVSQYLVPPDDSLKIILQKAEDFIRLNLAEDSIFAKTNKTVH